MVSELKVMIINFLINNRIKLYRMKFNAYIKKLLMLLQKFFKRTYRGESLLFKIYLIFKKEFDKKNY